MPLIMKMEIMSLFGNLITGANSCIPNINSVYWFVRVVFRECLVTIKFTVKLATRRLVHDYKLPWSLNKDIWHGGNGANGIFWREKVNQIHLSNHWG